MILVCAACSMQAHGAVLLGRGQCHLCLAYRRASDIEQRYLDGQKVWEAQQQRAEASTVAVHDTARRLIASVWDE